MTGKTVCLNYFPSSKSLTLSCLDKYPDADVPAVKPCVTCFESKTEGNR